MKRISLATAAVFALVSGLAAASASAQIVEIGATATPVVAPSCPPGVPAASCLIILTRTTALQTVSDSVALPTKVKKAGWLVAFTVGLSKLSTNSKTERTFIHALDQRYGGTPQVALTVLKPGQKNTYTVAAESPIFHVEPYLGSVFQFPLSLPPTFSAFNPLPVARGDVIALTVPTWAPVVSYNLTGSKFTFRQSQSVKADCGNHTTQSAQLTVGASTNYLCSYAGNRIQYSATEVTNQPYPKGYVHAPRKP